jgi:hypothetical protein
MGYNLYITRASNFWETKDFPIIESEWLAVAEADPTLSYSTSDYYDQRLEDGHIERIHPWLYVAHPEKPPLWYIGGAIETKNPDTQLISKMVEIADKLNAKVIGEEGEVYDSSGNATSQTEEPPPQTKSWWKRILRKK